MITISEYTGQLMGGPEDGNLVTSSVTRIPVSHTSTLWLDGKNDTKIPIEQKTEGTYIWNENEGHFKWELKGVGYETRY